MITRMDKYVSKQKQIYTWLNQVSTKLLAVLSVHVFFLVLIVLVDELDYRAKVSLFAFLSAMTLWIVTKFPAGFVAIVLILFIILLKAGNPELLYNALAEEVVWLMIGSFIIGEAVKQSGLAERHSQYLLSRSKQKSHALFGITSILFGSAFFIPSTSGRAALSMPIIKQLHSRFSPKEQSVLAIMAPVIILMSTSATLIGAGSHIIGISLLENTVGESISYIQWLLWGGPFALFITLISFTIIKWMWWPKDGSKEMKDVKIQEIPVLRQPLNKSERKTVMLITFLIIGWVTESLHGYGIALITMIGAVLFMLPNYGVVSWEQGMKSVSWNLIIFVAAATALGKVLVDTGVVHWIEQKMFRMLHLFVDAPDWLIVLVILLVTVTSHLYITSHTTRAVVFIPSLIVFSETIGVNAATVVFLGLIGMNYCVTFPVSSKALLFFYEEGDISYDARHLVKLSAVLMPLYILITMMFYFSYWQWAGMQL